jgi:excisionase family DNA binding protein
MKYHFSEVWRMKLLTLRQVADVLQVTERSAYRYIKDGKLKENKVGKSWRIDQ